LHTQKSKYEPLSPKISYSLYKLDTVAQPFARKEENIFVINFKFKSSICKNKDHSGYGIKEIVLD
jgi:hypothetical protein